MDIIRDYITEEWLLWGWGVLNFVPVPPPTFPAFLPLFLSPACLLLQLKGTACSDLRALTADSVTVSHVWTVDCVVRNKNISSKLHKSTKILCTMWRNYSFGILSTMSLHCAAEIFSKHLALGLNTSFSKQSNALVQRKTQYKYQHSPSSSVSCMANKLTTS